ncbi:P-loop containing nucleoside triphosphate hydrolase protein [Daldinia grandis]|nr:P-loop containing nucleoside triphosphate hydrolase protein [Daldinia grandis]
MQSDQVVKIGDHLSVMQTVLDDETITNQIISPEIEQNNFETRFMLPRPEKTTQDEARASHAITSLHPSHTEGNEKDSSDGSQSRADSGNTAGGDHDLDTEEEAGWEPEVKHLYADEGSPDIYKERIPLSAGINAWTKGVDRTKSFAIIHKHQASRGQLKTNSITIQSPELNNRLAEILSEYPNVDTKTPTVKFKPPFMSFLHRWDHLIRAENEEGDGNTKQLLCVLRQTLDSELEDEFKASCSLEKTGYISFQHILVPFIPGEIVLRLENGVPSAAILKEAYIEHRPQGETRCILKVRVLDWNGVRIGYRVKTWSIGTFDGFRRVADLPVSPLQRHPDRDQTIQSLIKRGRAFESLCGQHVRKYSGKVHVKRKWYCPQDRTIVLSERVIIDAEGYYRFQEKYVPELKKLDTKGKASTSTTLESAAHSPASVQNSAPLTDDECILTVPRVRGFALSSKEWYKFDVTDITPATWNSRLLENLVLQKEEKEMLLALVAQSTDPRNDEFDDFFEGKGKGLIMLLAGPPGVGKTLTAESVAEELRKPLYRISAGDLGSSVSGVESSLTTAFAQCVHWNAVLLIDEADVFLERRSADRMSQNELVSVFLTTLEYYQGVLILTTNRTQDIDSAFESRIDIILTYDHLNQDVRRQVWSKFIGRLANTDIKESDLDSLSQWVINGRQIKSAVKTAHIIAVKQGEALGMSHLETVLEVRKRGSRLIGKDEKQWRKTRGGGKLTTWIRGLLAKI